jgi:hypothetical protein
MKKLTSALAVAALVAVPTAYAQPKFEVGVDLDVRGYFLDQVKATPAVPSPIPGAPNLAEATTAGTTSDIHNRMRVNATYTSPDNIKAVTRVQISNRSWQGDATGAGDRAGETPFTQGHAHEQIGLDLAYADVPMGPGLLRVGRIETSWSNNFTTSDDRRDRIQYSTRVAGQTAFIFMDRRVGGDNIWDEGRNSFYVGSVGMTPIGLFGWIVGYWDGADTDALNGAVHFAPYLQTKLGSISLAAGLDVWNGGEVVWSDTHYSGYLRLGTDVGPVKLEGQYVLVKDGGLVANGFDTFSSLIHNSPNHSASPTRIAGLDLGGRGADIDRHLLALRASMDVTPALRVTGAAGWINYDGYSPGIPAGAVGNPNPVPAGMVAFEADEDVTFVDLQVRYQLRPSASVTATLGRVMSEDYLGTDYTAGAVTLRAAF